MPGIEDEYISYDDLKKMREEIREFEKIIKENRVESYNPEYHLSKEVLADLVGVSINRITGLAKEWEEQGIFKKVQIRYPNGHRGVGYVLFPDWKENLLKLLKEEGGW